MAQIFWPGIHGRLALPINLERYKFDSLRVLSARMVDALIKLVRTDVPEN